jgi:hypothetical protein
MSDNEKKHGGYRPNSGPKKKEITKKFKGIFLEENVFKILELQKKQLNSKSWTAFLVDKLGIK